MSHPLLDLLQEGWVAESRLSAANLELLAPLGWFRGLMAEIERRAGPTFIRDLAHPATR